MNVCKRMCERGNACEWVRRSKKNFEATRQNNKFNPYQVI
jgi:hypothetical protein